MSQVDVSEIWGLNSQIAKFMGWLHFSGFGWYYRGRFWNGHGRGVPPHPAYDADLAAAMEVLDRLTETPHLCEVSIRWGGANGLPSCRVRGGSGREVEVVSEYGLAGLAATVCRAVLMYLTVYGEEDQRRAASTSGQDGLARSAT